jgi:hypothetical protein
MPATPYAKLLVSVNGGALTSGGIDVPSGATLQFSGESTVGWKQQRYELYEYPEGFATPIGWTLAADGTLFYASTAVPPLVTLPPNYTLWGPWSPRLKINEAIDDNATTIPNLIDETTICNMLSPRGQRMIAALEGVQFCTPTTLQKRWVRTLQRNQRILEGTLPLGKDLLADFATTTSLLAQSTNLVIPVGSSDEGVLEFGGNTSVASGTAGVKFAISAPTGAALDGELFGDLASLTALTGVRISSTALTTAFNTAAATTIEPFRGSVRIKMDGTNAGNIILQIAPTAAVVATLKAGAWVRWHPSVGV